jgi:hypothetical protein
MREKFFHSRDQLHYKIFVEQRKQRFVVGLSFGLGNPAKSVLW